ncbi:MAG: metallophosphoesterase family protein [Chloroflexota bacterium]
MRLAVLSDIHGNKVAFDAVLEDLASVGDVDFIWCLGDYAAFGTQPAACVARLRELHEEHGKDKVKVIGGNTDRYIVTGKRPEIRAAKEAEKFEAHQKRFKERDDLLNWALAQLSWDDYEFLAKSVGREVGTEVEGYGAVIGYHAIPSDDDQFSLRPNSSEEEAMDALLDRGGRLAIGGHTHLVMDRQLGNWRVLNPGSIGMSFTDINFAEWALITFEKGEANVDFRKVSYDFQSVLNEVESVGYPHPSWIQRLTK